MIRIIIRLDNSTKNKPQKKVMYIRGSGRNKILDTHAVVKETFRPPTKSLDTTKQSLIFLYYANKTNISWGSALQLKLLSTWRTIVIEYYYLFIFVD